MKYLYIKINTMHLQYRNFVLKYKLVDLICYSQVNAKTTERLFLFPKITILYFTETPKVLTLIALVLNDHGSNGVVITVISSLTNFVYCFYVPRMVFLLFLSLTPTLFNVILLTLDLLLGNLTPT